MYISEISGHHSATLAIEKSLKILEPRSEILNINAFNYTNPISEKVVNRIYMGVIRRTPQIWEYLYDNPKVAKKIASLKNSVHKFNSPKLKVLFDKFRPDAVVCTQAFPCGMVADYKKDFSSPLPLVAVLTDYIPHSYWIYNHVNYYISPCEEVSERLVKKGAPAEKIKTFGIPFDPKFNQRAARPEIARRLGLSAGLPTVLVMGGGQGLGPIKTIIRSIDKLGIELQQIVVAGSNQKLYKSLKRKTPKLKNKTLVFAYVDNIHELMDASDVIITKPGGITAAEATAKGLPIVIVRPIPGQEAHNSAYLTQKGAAIKVEKPKEAAEAIKELLSDGRKLQEMRAALSQISKPNASMDIAKLLLSLV
jgi:processive 1,2-diacylglycerol beta-glucosyltransferase